eukprot:3930601-Prymnesium_polylepis.1
MCFCHEVTESSPYPEDHVASPISSDAGTSQLGITAHNSVLGSQHSTSLHRPSISLLLQDTPNQYFTQLGDKRWRDPSKRVRVGDALAIPTIVWCA